ncbi:HEAT repeat domain-containing protein [Salinibacterium sp. SWN1162]|uniref:HEAT repeat domain-containing protein n=1 Tax=Salinibacterium sp. SWN1162 TaxID=2792053 RepID=UPI0018CDF307|nr:HEAT repeat domain-containing protein [Salinibacterium sp. SWN1162]MBH0009773.1 HEAT repeat domain-containing protein [Salinibacterium sp. SWN1162]
MDAAASAADRLTTALTDTLPSQRLQAAMSAGTHPRDEFVRVLLERCAIEPDLNVRETLTWALMRHPSSVTVPLLVSETRSGTAQARSQALHTLSKIGDPAGWEAITAEVLNDSDENVARTAWRVATVLVPEGSETELAALLVTHLGSGGHDARMSLSRSLVTLGDHAAVLLEEVADNGSGDARLHALTTVLLRQSPDDGYEAALFDAELRLLLADAAAPEGLDAGAGADATADADATDNADDSSEDDE